MGEQKDKLREKILNYLLNVYSLWVGIGEPSSKCKYTIYKDKWDLLDSYKPRKEKSNE